jgi:hypothetical protein
MAPRRCRNIQRAAMNMSTEKPAGEGVIEDLQPLKFDAVI